MTRFGPLCVGLISLLLATLGQAATPSYRLAVLPFRDASPEAGLEKLGHGLQSMLTTDLSHAPQIVLVERARLADVRAEIALSRSRDFDPATAAQVGKLLGASHLLVGSFTVVGGVMRLDARLVRVADAEVLAGEKIEGELEAFFELEKRLATAVVVALKLTLPARVRGELARTHTTDYKAFERFSEGLQRFDQGRYDDAIAALREASRLDGRFELARTTLADLQRLIHRVRARRAVVQRVEAETASLDDDAHVERLVAWVDGLRARAEREQAGGGRLVAMYLLASLWIHQPRGFNALLRRLDRFAARRRGEAWLARLWPRALARYPLVRLVPEGRPQYLLGRVGKWVFPDKDGKPVSPLAKHWRAIRDSMSTDSARQVAYSNHLERLVRTAGRLHVTRLGALRLAEEALEITLARWRHARQVQVPRFEPWRHEQRLRLARAYTRAAALDDAGRILAGMAATTTRSSDLEEIEASLQEIVLVRRFLDEGLPNRAEALELLRLEGMSHADRYPADAAGIESLLSRARKPFRPKITAERRRLAVARARRWGRCSEQDYILVARRPVWALQGCDRLATGPRDDPRRTGSLRYYHHEADSAPPALALSGAAPIGDATVTLTVGFDRPADWWPAQVRLFRSQPIPTLRPERAQAGLLLGATNANVQRTGSSLLPSRLSPTAMRATLVRVREGAVEIVSLTGSFADEDDPDTRFEETVLARAPLGSRRASSVRLKVRVQGETIRATAGSARIRARLEEPVRGFTGIWFSGAGFASVGPMAVRSGS